MAMLTAAMATASSIQFWNGTRPSTRNSSTSQSSKEAPRLQFIGDSLFDGHLAAIITPAISPPQGLLIVGVIENAGGSGRFFPKKAQRRPSGI